MNKLGDYSLKDVRIKLLPHTNLPWNKIIGSLLYIKRNIVKNSLNKVSRITHKNVEEFNLVS